MIADSFTPVFTEETLKENVLEDRAVRSEAQVNFWRFAQGEDREAVIEADTAMLERLLTAAGTGLAMPSAG